MNTANGEPAKLISKIEKLLPEYEATVRLRHALSLAAEAARTPIGPRRDQLMKDADAIVRQVLGVESC